MADLYSIIQKLMKYSKNGQKVDIQLKSGEIKTGIISNFSGTSFIIDELQIMVNDVEKIEENNVFSLENYIMKLATITMLDKEELEGVIVSVMEDSIVCITEDEKRELKNKNIYSIRIGEKVIVVNDKKDSSDNEMNNDMNFLASDVLEEKQNKTGIDHDTIEKRYFPNDFEEALIKGDKNTVNEFILNNRSLSELGYNEGEIVRICKSFTNSSWKTDLLSIGARIKLFQNDKNGLARTYYEKALESSKTGSPEYIKALNILVQYVHEDGFKDSISFWKKHGNYLKENQSFCKELINVILKEKNISVNQFEQALICGDDKAAKELAENVTKLLEMGYSEDDIERIRKTIKSTNWDIGWYKTATRLFSMQKNKNGLAEVFYEASLLIANRKGDEYNKTINAIASIKIAENKEEFVTFFNVYRDKLKTNLGFCSTYANALRTTQNWKKLEKDLPMLREQLKKSPEFIQKIEEEIEYAKSLPPFDIKNFPVLLKRMEDEETIDDQEKDLINHLPDKNAIKSLLDIYLSPKNEEAYFELARYALFFIREDRDCMNKLFKILNETDKKDSIVFFIEKVPVFWCSDYLIRKYEEIKAEADTRDLMESEGKFIEHLRSIPRYYDPNAFETAIINRDSNIVRNFVNNPTLLEKLGYSESEIEDILSVDIEQQLSEDSYTMKRILAFQGNKNHLAERFLFEAFYNNKSDMCNRLFPLLLEEGRGALILSLFEFDRTLKSRTNSLKRFYCLALCISEKNDDIFWEQMQKTWMEYPDEMILNRMLSIAKAKQNGQLIKQLEKQKNRLRLNAFETALVDADTDTIRKYVKNAELLVELGYTPDEIQKISKVFSVGGGETNNGMKPGQIANRVFLYQKNKNNLAEKLFINAINEDAPGDKMGDCRSLYQIYIGQHNYAKVCQFYEEYIHLEMEQKFNRFFASYYCISLFEQRRYTDFLEYYKKYREKWTGFTLYANLLYICEVLDIHDYDDEFMDDEILSKCHPDTMAMYIKYVLKNDISRVYSEKIINIINRFFISLSNDDISEIIVLLSDIKIENIIRPQGSLVVALISEEERNKNLELWFKHYSEKFDDNMKIDVLLKIESVFNNESYPLVDEAISVYREVIKTDINGNRMDALVNLISRHISEPEDISVWSEIQAESLKSGKGGINSLKKYLKTASTNVKVEDFWSVYLKFINASQSEITMELLFNTVMDYYKTIQAYENKEKKKIVVNELIRLSEGAKLDYTRYRSLANICLECGMEFASKIFCIASEKFVPQSAEKERADINKTDNKMYYIDYLLENLNTNKAVSNKRIFSVWSKYIMLSDEDNEIINRLRNTAGNSQLWVRSEIDILAKAILSDPTNSVYWKLLQIWIEKKPDRNTSILGSIYYYASLQDTKEKESALSFAIDNDLKDVALELTLTMLDIKAPSINIVAQKNLRTMIKKGWFSDSSYEEKTHRLFGNIKDSLSLSDAEDYIWNGVSVALELAMATEQYMQFMQFFDEYLTRSCAKQCCALISDMLLKENTEGIETAIKYMDEVFTEIPYKSIVLDLYNTNKTRNLENAEKMALECIKKNYGNVLGVNDLLGFYCDMTLSDMKQCGLDTIKLFINYTKYDPLLYEIAACFLREKESVEENEQYYNYMFDYMESALGEEPIEYVVGAMVCGENYLKLCGREVRSVKNLIKEQYDNSLNIAKNYQDFCDCINVGLRTTGYEEFAKILFRAVFSGDWVSVLKYFPSDSNIDIVLKNNINNGKINVIDEYYRSVVKGIGLYILEKGNDENYDRIRILWKNIGNLGCEFDFYREALRKADDDCKAELRRIWSLDIETLTVFKKYLGKSIVSQKNCSRYPEIFKVFLNPRNGDLFTNVETQECLKQLDKETAITICENFEKLYVHAQAPTTYEKKLKGIKNSDYENNIFSNYLKRNTDDYFNIEKRYQRFKKKYDLLMRVNNITDIQEANDMNFNIVSKRLIFPVRALLYYYSVLADKIDREIFREENEYAEAINAITIAMSEDSFISDIYDFIAKTDNDLRKALGILVLLEQDKTDKAASIVLKEFSGEEQGYLCAKIVACYGKSGKDKELCQNCLITAKQSGIKNMFWIKNLKHSKMVDRIDPYGLLSRESSEEENNARISDADEKRSNREIVDESIAVSTKSGKSIDEMFTEIPEYIRNFISKEYEDVELSKYKHLWEKKNAALENGKGTQDSLDEISIKIGECLIKKQNTGFDEGIMRETFGLIRRNAIHDVDTIDALHNILQTYIREYTELDSLARSVYENRNELAHLRYEQDMKQNKRKLQDVEAASALVDVLINISNDLSGVLSEEIIKERLREYQTELHIGIKNVSKFRDILFLLRKMIQDKINKLNYVPLLFISHMNYDNANISKNFNWNETWMRGAEKSYIRGVVFNRGGAPAHKVVLNVTINGESRGEYTIDRVDSGRRIPFKVQYNRNDVRESKVLWGAYLTYYDEINSKPKTSSVYGEISVSLSDEEWEISYVGREKFDIDNSAEDDNFCGRKNELLKLDSIFNIDNPPKKYPSLLITGLRRMGKSSLIKFFKKRLLERDNLVPIYVDGQMLGGVIQNCFFNCVFMELESKIYKNTLVGYEDFKKRWMKVAENPDWLGNLPLYFMELSELFGGRKVIFFLDEMENVFFVNHFDNEQREKNFYDMIRSIIQNCKEYVSFVFCGADQLLTSCLEQKSESQIFQVLQRIYVGRMNINDIRDLFCKYNKEYDIKFGDDAIDAIMFYTNGLVWYTKIIAYYIIDKIIDIEHVLRNEVHVSDVNEIVDSLIKGDLGSDKISLLDNNLDPKRKAILHAMAKVISKPYESANTSMITSMIENNTEPDDKTGEIICSINYDELCSNLQILEKMDFIVKDPNQEDSYAFSTELYRLLMSKNRKIDKFVKVRRNT